VRIAASDGQRFAALRAMATVCTAGGRPLSEADAVTIAAADAVAFGASGQIEPHGLAPIAPAALATALVEGPQRLAVGRLLCIAALVDGVIDAERIACLGRFATALGLHEQYLVDLAEAAAGHLAWVGADLSRQNVVSLTHGAVQRVDDYDLYPYRARGGDAALVARYEALAALPPGTLGREFLDWYGNHHFALPGDAESVAEAFVQPHDSTHLLSGYSTSPQGELLVSAFTSGMVGEGEPLGSHILPVLFSFHLGIRLNDLAGAWRGAFDGEKFFHAWDRGTRTATDLFAADWDFWSVASVPIADLRLRYAVPPLDPRLAATDGAAMPVSPAR
jgi:hypothetical protein